MRKLIRNKRGDISAPIITILLVIASISIAALVISWLFGVGIATSKQANIIIVGTPTLQVQGNNAVLYITLKNVGNTPANIIGIYLQGPTTTYTFTPPSTMNTLQPGDTIPITATFSNVNFGSATSVNGVIQTTAGTIPFIAVIQKL